MNGLIALMHGKFNQTIEKFSFQGWTLADVAEEERINLEKGFRSYSMI